MTVSQTKNIHSFSQNLSILPNIYKQLKTRGINKLIKFLKIQFKMGRKHRKPNPFAQRKRYNKVRNIYHCVISIISKIFKLTEQNSNGAF